MQKKALILTDSNEIFIDKKQEDSIKKIQFEPLLIDLIKSFFNEEAPIFFIARRTDRLFRRKIEYLFAQHGIEITGYIFQLPKENVLSVLRQIQQEYSIDLSTSLFIGRDAAEFFLGRRAGCPQSTVMDKILKTSKK